MNDCQAVHEWLPWYVSGSLSPTKMQRMAAHISQCENCQKELARVIQLRHAVVSDIDATPTPSSRVWETIEPDLDAHSTPRIDVGSFLIGLKVGIATHGRKQSVQGDLRVLGHKVRIIGKRKKGA
ncbi:anti-sigma factor family protein [Candidatus Bipolaricaulota bacterium]